MEKSWVKENVVCWKKIECDIQSFISKNEEEAVHIIKTGFVDKYIAVFEDAHQLVLGETYIGTKAEVELRCGVKL